MSKANRNKPIVYDTGPTDEQIRFIDNIESENLTVADLSDPKVAQILIHNQRVSLAQIKSLQDENRSFLVENEQLRKDREELRIRAATTESKSSMSWLEIPISILSGFAINMLTSNFKEPVGWLLLLVSIVMLIPLRGEQIVNLLRQQKT